MIRRPPRSTLSSSSAASDVYKRQVFGIASFLNSRLVTRIAPDVLVKYAIGLIVFSSMVYLVAFRDHSVSPPLYVHLVYLSLIMGSFAFLFGNTTSLAMEPMGHIAGAASSVVNSFSTLIAIMVAIIVLNELTTDEAAPAIWPIGSMARDVVLPNKKAKDPMISER